MCYFIQKKLLIIFFLIPLTISAQRINSDSAKIQHVIDSLAIKLNKPEIPSGFKLYYSCDSMVFFKKINKDTITILTPSGITPMSYESIYEINSFSYYISHRKNYPPSFPRRYLSDGRIEIDDYGPTIFIFRHDSLFMRTSDDEIFVNKMFQIIGRYVKHKIDSTKMERQISFARKKYKPIWMTCFVFNKNMFNSSLTIDINPKLNPRNAIVTLENKWENHDVTCYSILIEENYNNLKTAVRYTFDGNLKFVKWEGCEK